MKTLIFFLLFASTITLGYSQKEDYTIIVKEKILNLRNQTAPGKDEIAYFLEHIHTPELLDYIPRYRNFNNQNVDETNEKRIINVLNNIWSFSDKKWKWKIESVRFEDSLKEKIKLIYGEYIKISPYKELCDKENIKVRIYDSLIVSAMQTFENELQRFPINKEVILAAGWIKIKEALPILKKAYNSKDSRYDKTATGLALARFGEKDVLIDFLSLKKYLNNLDRTTAHDAISEMYYIGSQESIFSLNKLVDTLQTLKYGHGHSNKIFYASGYLIKELKYLIGNPSFQSLYHKAGLFDENDFDASEVKKELIISIKEWLIKNKGKYDIIPAYCLEKPVKFK